ncbi:hypothetical protein E4U52_001668 [Claviceps spartinae]|nr:hypothetical protein E4U52_001668 [Claviceps spartinae]
MRLRLIGESSDDACLAHAGGGGMAMHHQASLDQLDDVFGSAPASPTTNAPQHDSHPSDIARLETEHTTAGYREGITVAKESSIQAGFDEGFSLGAALGSQAGQLLGIVEGIADALQAHSEEALQASNKLLNDAREELSTAKIFSAEYWAPDGNWKYEVTAAHQDQPILFSDVANAHPLVQKWRNLVNEQVGKWNIQTSLLDNETAPRIETAAAEPPPPTSTPASRAAKQTLDW